MSGNGRIKQTNILHALSLVTFMFYLFSTFLAQNAYCSQELAVQEYLRSVILPGIIQVNARKRVSNGLFFP